jgi:hypothetical protein
VTAPAPRRLPCPACGKPVGLTRAEVRLMPHRAGRPDALLREDGMCAGSRALVADLPTNEPRS